MKRPPPHPHLRIHHPAYREAFRRLDESLEQTTQSDNSEKIRLMRQAYFADVDALQKSGKIKLPKWNRR